MMLRKQRWLIYFCIFVAIVIIVALLMNVYNKYFYIQNVLTAIQDEDIPKLQKLMNYPLKNLDSKPTWWIVEVLNEKNESTPLQAACKLGNPQIVKILLENGANVNYTHWDKSRDAGSPLINAASSLSSNRLEVIKLLVEYGADVHYESATGNDALSCAVYVGNDGRDTIEIIEYLENCGMNLHKKYSQTENSLLHKACENDNFLVVQYLIEQRNFDVNITNADGDTPLVYFLRFGSQRKENIPLFLIQKGANLNAKNKDGYTAYDYAVERHPEFLSLLD